MKQAERMEDDPFQAELLEEIAGVDDPDPDAPVQMVVAEQGSDLIAIADEIERRVDAATKIRRAVFKYSYPKDWRINEGKDGGEPTAYLQSKGAQRIASLLGIGWDVTHTERHSHTDSDGKGYYSYTVKGYVTWRGRRIPAEGGCSSKHPLLSKGGKIPSEDVNEVHVRKKAKTDFIRTGVCEICGLKDIPVGEMPDGWASKIPTQTYRNGTQGGDTSTDSDRAGQDEVSRLINDICGGNQDACRDYLERMTTFKGRDGEMVKGLRTTKYLKGKRLEITLEKIRKEHGAWSGGAS